MGYRIEPATADRFDDVATLLNPRGHERACWCLAWRRPRGLSPGEGAAHLRELSAHDPRPGLLAYLDEDGTQEVVGWVGLAPRSAVPSLQRSRVLPRSDPETAGTTWVVMCFVVRPGYRRRGVARALLHGAVDHARAHGGRVIEGFPVEPEPGRRVPVGAAYVGTVPLFESAGFDRVGETAATSGRLPRWVLRRELATD
ncbi:GNAT family N-acetyltransferase [Isoptericola haloaureus]|uniref:GNAT family N-acetyltransferase n=1 Tax=Isoptericola haloaureus TaxID=1542902 RepID=A0ABU7Z2X3_9MICO